MFAVRPPRKRVDDSHQHQLLGKHHVCAICRAVVQRRTGTDQAGERLVARYNPRIATISVLTLAELFKDGWSGGSKLAPIIYALPVARKDARNRIEMRGDSFVSRVRVKEGFGEEIGGEMRDILKTFAGKRFGTANPANHDHYYFLG